MFTGGGRGSMLASPRNPTMKGHDMGFFKKTKENFDAGQQNAAQAQQMTAAYQAQQQAGAQQGMIGVQGMGPIAADPAILGGPSTKPLAADDPMLQPVNGVS